MEDEIGEKTEDELECDIISRVTYAIKADGMRQEVNSRDEVTVMRSEMTDW